MALNRRIGSPLAPNASIGRGAASGFDQLAVNEHTFADLAYAAYQDIAYPQLATGLLDIRRSPLVGKAGVSGDHEEVLEAR